jgi:hypothetical protein
MDSEDGTPVGVDAPDKLGCIITGSYRQMSCTGCPWTALLNVVSTLRLRSVEVAASVDYISRVPGR